MAISTLTVGLAVVKDKVLPVGGISMARLTIAGDVGMGAIDRFQRQVTIRTLAIGLAMIEYKVLPISGIGMARFAVAGDVGVSTVIRFNG